MKSSLAALKLLAASCTLSAAAAFAQPPAQEHTSSPHLSAGHFVSDSQSPRFWGSLFAGARASVSAWQLPLFAASLLTERQKAGNGLPMPPLEVDHEIAEELSRRDGASSLGSISPRYYPLLAVRGRLAGMILLDAFTSQNYSPASYAKLFRFQQAVYFNSVVTHLAKRNFNRRRPDGSDSQSFFSGHTSTAFATSTFLYLEVRDFIAGETRQGRDLPLLSAAQWQAASFGLLYGWAAYVGYSRIHDNKHYLSDVLVGAASGTLVSYLLYPHQNRKPSPSRFALGFVPLPRGPAMAVSYSF